MSASLYKMHITGQLQKSIKFILQQISKLFFFFCFVLQERPMIHFWYMNLKIMVAHEYPHAKQRRLLVISETGANKNCPSFTVVLSIRYKDRFSWRIWLKYIHSPQSKKMTVMLTFPSWGSQPRMGRQYSPQAEFICHQHRKIIPSGVWRIIPSRGWRIIPSRV